MFDTNPNDAAAAPVSVNAGFDTTPITATVIPAEAPPAATVETGFGELDGTSAPLQPAAPTVVADTGKPEDPDADLDARVAGLLSNKSTTNWNAVQTLMAAVVPWPASPNDDGWVNIHWAFTDKDGTRTPPKAGRAFKDISDFMGFVAWALPRPERVKDMYFCTSLQKDTKGLNKQGKPKAAKSGAAALALRSIWIDLDVKENDPKCYGSEAEALKAVFKFAMKVGLPQPSAIVRSGGGLHVYWINNVDMTPKEWHPYAQGLKNLLLANNVLADAGLTTDAARILRIPGTLNHKPKYPKPRPVELIDIPLHIHPFATRLAFLIEFAGPVIAPTAQPVQHSIFAETDMDWAKFGKPDPAYAGLPDEPGLQAGIDKHEDFKVDPRPIFGRAGCGFYRDALRNGGADHDNNLWNIAVLGSTFMENGNDIAHKISSGHREYTEADTQALYDRKVAERAAGKIGYPFCSTIKGYGCSSCATCPLAGTVKSPLNIRSAITATVTGTSSPSGSSGQATWTGRSGVSYSNIRHRQWLYGTYLVRGELTVIGSPGGAGKSSLAIGMAICCATNRELLGEKIRGGANLKALVINGEDSTEEIRRRVYAFGLAHGIAEGDLHGLTIAGADDTWVQRISFLTTSEKGVSALNEGGLDALQLALDALHPDVIVIDPLVSFCAGGNMNDNAVMSTVMRKLKEMATLRQCAVLIVHHTRKGGDAGNVETISGAASITNLARRAIMPAPLTDDDVKKLGVLPSERFGYFKLVDAKSNLAPRATDSPLYRLCSVELPNPEPPLYPNGDGVQAITRVLLPIQPSGAASADEMKIEAAIFELVDQGKEIDGQRYPYSPSLAGANNERELLPDAMVGVANATAPRQWASVDLEGAIKTAIDKMLADGRLVVEDVKDLMPKPGRFRRARGLKAVPI